MIRERNKRPAAALDEGGLERLALFYAERYATTRFKLRAYLSRKIRERGWAGTAEPPLDALVERFARLGYVDDRAFASSRASSLIRRGYGERRVAEALRAAGIESADSQGAREEARGAAWDSALRFARRKRIGPWAVAVPDRDGRRRAAGAMLRAGHDPAHVRRLVDARPGEIPDSDED
ncbi:MAG TPA: RecX family transcriptional regulator [Allosphingosinicella sp.]